MCLDSQRHVQDELITTARRSIQHLLVVEELSTTARALEALLDTSTPLVVPAPDPVPGQISAAAMLGQPFNAYPSVLQSCLGPPTRIGRDPLLGYVFAQCALSALRHHETQAALSALFLSSLCASRPEPAALEALHHLLLETDVDHSLGLLTLPAWRTATAESEVTRLRQRYLLRFVTTAVQINGTMADPESAPAFADPGGTDC